MAPVQLLPLQQQRKHSSTTAHERQPFAQRLVAQQGAARSLSKDLLVICKRLQCLAKAHKRLANHHALPQPDRSAAKGPAQERSVTHSHLHASSHAPPQRQHILGVYGGCRHPDER